ncbi:MAG TPA: hypothetical protein VJQ51_14990, partial [Burkholderiales bacterium]|nr:hypothetical protein [Burkholderiales bacterium]
MRVALLVAGLLSAAIAGAQNPAPVSLQSLAAPLLKARTYCESGKWGVSNGPKVPMSETSYRVCASSDGRFKYVESPGEPQQFVIWSDGQTLHRYVPYGGIYQTHDLAAPDAAYTYPQPREQVPALHSRLFRAATRSAAGLDLLGTFRDYRINEGLSDGQRTVYEFIGDDKRSVTRIQVTAAGGITRLESWYGGTLSAFME